MAEQLEIEKDAGQIEAWMMDGLLALMEKKPYGEIRVKEISSKAKSVRCTFYRYYISKDELLLRCCQIRR